MSHETFRLAATKDAGAAERLTMPNTISIAIELNRCLPALVIVVASRAVPDFVLVPPAFR